MKKMLRCALSKPPSGGGGPPLDPGTDISPLFSSGQVGGWYDPSDLSTLFQDTAATTPVTTTNQNVMRINDKSGNNLHLLANSGGVPGVLQNDGSKNYIDLSGLNEPNGGYLLGPVAIPATHEMVIGYDNQGENRGMWWSQQTDTNTWTNIFVDGATGALSGNFTFTTLRVDGVVVPVANRNDTHDAIVGKHVSFWSTNTDQRNNTWCFASYAGASVNLTPSGRLYGLVWRQAFDVNETALVEQYMAEKTGIVL